MQFKEKEENLDHELQNLRAQLEQMNERNNELDIAKRIESEQQEKQIYELEDRVGAQSEEMERVTHKLKVLEQEKLNINSEIELRFKVQLKSLEDDLQHQRTQH